jgi:hypothetical protein
MSDQTNDIMLNSKELLYDKTLVKCDQETKVSLKQKRKRNVNKNSLYRNPARI